MFQLICFHGWHFTPAVGNPILVVGCVGIWCTNTFQIRCVRHRHRHRHLWLHWIMSFFQIIISIGVLVSVVFGVRVTVRAGRGTLISIMCVFVLWKS
jgi:hypothetical protein